MGVATIAFLAGLGLVTAMPSDGNKLVPFENFEKIKEGMSVEEVKAALGPATQIKRMEAPLLLSFLFGGPTSTHRYVGRRDIDCERPIIVIDFSCRQTVSRTDFRREYDPTFSQRLLDRIKQTLWQ